MDLIYPRSFKYIATLFQYIYIHAAITYISTLLLFSNLFTPVSKNICINVVLRHINIFDCAYLFQYIYTLFEQLHSAPGIRLPPGSTSRQHLQSQCTATYTQQKTSVMKSMEASLHRSGWLSTHSRHQARNTQLHASADTSTPRSVYFTQHAVNGLSTHAASTTHHAPDTRTRNSHFQRLCAPPPVRKSNSPWFSASSNQQHLQHALIPIVGI